MMFTYHDRLSIRGNAPLLTQKQIEALEDGSIVYVQWPSDEWASPYKIRRRDFNDGYDRPWVYATDYHHYHEQPCKWDREITGYGLYKPHELRVWIREPPPEPEHEDGPEVFASIIWN